MNKRFGFAVQSDMGSPEFTVVAFRIHSHGDDHDDCILRSGVVISFVGFHFFIGMLV